MTVYLWARSEVSVLAVMKISYLTEKSNSLIRTLPLGTRLISEYFLQTHHTIRRLANPFRTG